MKGAIHQRDRLFPIFFSPLLRAKRQLFLKLETFEAGKILNEVKNLLFPLRTRKEKKNKKEVVNVNFVSLRDTYS